MAPSTVDPDKNNENFVGLYYRVDVKALIDRVTVTSCVKGTIEFVVQEPQITDDFRQFLMIRYG